jgi:hypothetical protein
MARSSHRAAPMATGATNGARAGRSTATVTSRHGGVAVPILGARAGAISRTPFGAGRSQRSIPTTTGIASGASRMDMQRDRSPATASTSVCRCTLTSTPRTGTGLEPCHESGASPIPPRRPDRPPGRFRRRRPRASWRCPVGDLIHLGAHGPATFRVLRRRRHVGRSCVACCESSVLADMQSGSDDVLRSADRPVHNRGGCHHRSRPRCRPGHIGAGPTRCPFELGLPSRTCARQRLIAARLRSGSGSRPARAALRLYSASLGTLPHDHSIPTGGASHS